MVQFSWVISELNCLVDQDGMQDVINVIHWRYNANDIDESGKNWFADKYGSSNVEQPNPQNFTPYADVTEQQVVSWLEQVLPVADMQANLIANIELQKFPIEVTLPLPWSTPTIEQEIVAGDQPIV